MKRGDIRVGMRVIAISAVDGSENCVGLVGTVKEKRCGRFDMGVEFDEPFRGGHGMCGAAGRCRFGMAYSFEPYYGDTANEKCYDDLELSFDKLMNGDDGV